MSLISATGFLIPCALPPTSELVSGLTRSQHHCWSVVLHQIRKDALADPHLHQSMAAAQARSSLSALQSIRLLARHLLPCMLASTAMDCADRSQLILSVVGWMDPEITNWSLKTPRTPSTRPFTPERHQHGLLPSYILFIRFSDSADRLKEPDPQLQTINSAVRWLLLLANASHSAQMSLIVTSILACRLVLALKDEEMNAARALVLSCGLAQVSRRQTEHSI